MISPDPSTAPPGALDLRLILVRTLGHFAIWLVIVLLATLTGYPGVVCVTPIAWLLAARLGVSCVRRSSSILMARRLQEAALAGGLLGFLQGILFWIIAPRLGPVAAGEQASATWLTVVMLLVGTLAGAGLAAFTAFLYEQRRRRARG